MHCAEKGEVVVEVEGFAATASWMLETVSVLWVVDFRLETVIVPSFVASLRCGFVSGCFVGLV